MRRSLIRLFLLIAFGSWLPVGVAAVEVELEWPGEKEGREEAWRAPFDKALDRRVSFEFVETPVMECIRFLQTLTNLNIVVAPKAFGGGEQPTVNLKVTNMRLETALTWVCRVAGLEWEVEDQAIHIFKQEPERAGEKEGNLVRPPQGKAPPARETRIRIKLSAQREIEISWAGLKALPGLTAALIDLAIDPADLGILAYRLPNEKDLGGISDVLRKVIPDIRVEYARDIGLLVVTGDELPLRRANVVMRALGVYHFNPERRVSTKAQPKKRKGRKHARDFDMVRAGAKAGNARERARKLAKIQEQQTEKLVRMEAHFETLRLARREGDPEAWRLEIRLKKLRKELEKQKRKVEERRIEAEEAARRLMDWWWRGDDPDGPLVGPPAELPAELPAENEREADEDLFDEGEEF